jgi:type II secretory pathway pseudopilin PulG
MSNSSTTNSNNSSHQSDGIWNIPALDNGDIVEPMPSTDNTVATTSSRSSSRSSSSCSNTSSVQRQCYPIDDEEQQQQKQQRQHQNQADNDNNDEEDQQVMQYDIPLNNASDVGTSLPTLEELKTEQYLRSGENNDNPNGLCWWNCRQYFCSMTSKHTSSFSRRRHAFLIVSFAIFVLIGTIVGISFLATSRQWKENTMKNNNNIKRHADIQEVISYLSSTYDISFFHTYQTSITPQYMAAQWMAETDGANWELPSTATDNNNNDGDDSINNTNDTNNHYAYRYLSRFVMALNYYAFHGSDWTNQLNFLSEYDICQWIGYVQGTASTELAGIFCDGTTNIPMDLSLCK